MESQSVGLVGRKTKFLQLPSWMILGYMRPFGPISNRKLAKTVGGKTVLVTGSSSGIGEETAYLLGKAGANVILVARRQDRLDLVADKINAAGPGSAQVFPADLSDHEDAARLAQQVVSEVGPVDILVNNAGKSINRTISDSLDRIHDYQRTMDINYMGPVRLVMELLPSMRENGGGHVVNVATAGLFGPSMPGWTPYLASKMAFDIFNRAVGVEFARKNITTNSVYMCLVSTEMSKPSEQFFEKQPSISPRAAAHLVCQAIVNPKQPSIAPWFTAPMSIFGQVHGPTEKVMRAAIKRQKGGGPIRGGTIKKEIV